MGTNILTIATVTQYTILYWTLQVVLDAIHYPSISNIKQISHWWVHVPLLLPVLAGDT